jgi:hypothetical protein
MSANLVSSIGYSLGKLHTGLLAYLCDLHRSGETEPLEALFRGLGVRVPSRPTPRREWNSVDLAIFEGDAASPCILIEMKVDDHEHGEEAGDPQTIRYATAHPNCESCLFITLGMGEYFNEPCDKQRFRWIRLRDFIAALDLVPNGVPVVEDWKRALHNEVDLQERAWRNDRSRLAEYRAGTWNIYVLGWIQKALWEMHLPGIGPRCFTCGSRPDTILNLGWNKSPYLEINNNGRLNLKLIFDEHSSTDEKRLLIQKEADWASTSFSPGMCRISEGGRIGYSKTVASFDIGLSVEDEHLKFSASQEEVTERLHDILRLFIARNGS